MQATFSKHSISCESLKETFRSSIIISVNARDVSLMKLNSLLVEKARKTGPRANPVVRSIRKQVGSCKHH